ncbi:hypothetical protein OF117_01385 [Geodermatophilus sp. YIM 151500]|nr:hypothetical protein [Geodermatophilus sp. YIM 151500]MCV2488002.1 hypothetical protein [Geodermatophilus sp. YIM 151500]
MPTARTWLGALAVLPGHAVAIVARPLGGWPSAGSVTASVVAAR